MALCKSDRLRRVQCPPRHQKWQDVTVTDTIGWLEWWLRITLFLEQAFVLPKERFSDMHLLIWEVVWRGILFQHTNVVPYVCHLIKDGWEVKESSCCITPFILFPRLTGVHFSTHFNRSSNGDHVESLAKLQNCCCFISGAAPFPFFKSCWLDIFMQLLYYIILYDTFHTKKKTGNK